MALDKDTRVTPQELFDDWDNDVNFTIDVAASATNTKCKRFYDEEQDGLLQSWGGGARLVQSSVLGDPQVGREGAQREECGVYLHAYSSESHRATILAGVHRAESRPWRSPLHVLSIQAYPVHPSRDGPYGVSYVWLRDASMAP